MMMIIVVDAKSFCVVGVVCNWVRHFQWALITLLIQRAQLCFTVFCTILKHNYWITCVIQRAQLCFTKQKMFWTKHVLKHNFLITLLIQRAQLCFTVFCTIVKHTFSFNKHNCASVCFAVDHSSFPAQVWVQLHFTLAHFHFAFQLITPHSSSLNTLICIVLQCIFKPFWCALLSDNSFIALILRNTVACAEWKLNKLWMVMKRDLKYCSIYHSDANTK